MKRQPRGSDVPSLPPRGQEASIESTEQALEVPLGRGGQLIARGRPGSLARVAWRPWNVLIGSSSVLAAALGAAKADLLLVFGMVIPFLLPSLVVSMMTLSDRRWRRTLARTPPVSEASAVLPGKRVRIRGRIKSGQSFARVDGPVPAVMSRLLGTVTRPDPSRPRDDVCAVEEMRALPFDVELDDGSTVRVEPSHAYLIGPGSELDERRRRVGLDARSRSVRRRFHEAGAHDSVIVSVEHEIAVGPGDRVDVLGSVHEAVHDGGMPAGYRDPPLTKVLVGTRSAPVIVRALAACRRA